MREKNFHIKRNVYHYEKVIKLKDILFHGFEPMTTVLTAMCATYKANYDIWVQPVLNWTLH